MEEASDKHETSGEGLPLESDKLIKLICFEKLKLICLSTELKKGNTLVSQALATISVILNILSKLGQCVDGVFDLVNFS